MLLQNSIQKEDCITRGPLLVKEELEDKAPQMLYVLNSKMGVGLNMIGGAFKVTQRVVCSLDVPYSNDTRPRDAVALKDLQNILCVTLSMAGQYCTQCVVSYPSQPPDAMLPKRPPHLSLEQYADRFEWLQGHMPDMIATIGYSVLRLFHKIEQSSGVLWNQNESLIMLNALMEATRDRVWGGLDSASYTKMEAFTLTPSKKYEGICTYSWGTSTLKFGFPADPTIARKLPAIVLALGHLPTERELALAIGTRALAKDTSSRGID